MENVDNEELVKRLLVLMSQRDKLDEEISSLRAEINSSLAEGRSAAVVAQDEAVVAEDEPVVATPPPFEVATPPPFVETPPVVPPAEDVDRVAPPPLDPKPSEQVDTEQKIGVKWMAIAGVFIAVLGLIICIKMLLDRDLIGSVGRVVLGYLASVAMVVASFKVPSTRKVLRETLVFGGFTFAYFVTCTAYGYFDLFSSPVALAILFTLTSTLLAFAYIKDNKLLFGYALMGFMISPFCAGYSFDSHTNRTVFWMVFTVVVNVALCFVYRLKKWSSAYATSFCVTGLICIIKFFDGADFVHWINVLYFAVLCAVFYAGAVVLHLVKPNFNYKFLFITALNFSVFAISTSIEFHNRHYISNTFLFMAVALCVTAFLCQKLLPEIKILFTAPFSYVLIFINLALLVNYIVEYSEWFALIYALEIMAAALVYWFTRVEYFKRITAVFIYLSFAVVFMGLIGFDYYYSLPDNYMVVLNVGFFAKLAYIAVLVLILRKVTDKIHKIILNFVLYSAVILTVAHEISIYWDYVDSNYTDTQENKLQLIMLVLWNGVLTMAAALIPKKWECLSVVKVAAYAVNLFNLLLFCFMVIPSLSGLYSTKMVTPYPVWRYVSIGVAVAMAVFATMHRKSLNTNGFDKLTDIVVSFAAVWIVSAEIVYLLSKVGGVNSYGLWLSVWFGVASLILFLVGFKLKYKHLRVCGFVLSAVMVLKLFFYDIWNSDWWVKAVVFVAVGVIFLLVSYFYSKHYKKEKDDGKTLGA